MTLGAALFLGEPLALRRMVAVGAALIGAVVILRPGFREIETGHFAMLLAALAFGGSYLIAKRLSDLVAPGVVVVMLSICVLLDSHRWQFRFVPPSIADILLLFVVAILATSGHYTMTLAFKTAPISVTQPATFLQLVWAVMFGILIFDEPIDIWVIIGGLVIIFAISFISWREAVLMRTTITPPSPAIKVKVDKAILTARFGNCISLLYLPCFGGFVHKER